jgi:hypothetical protein
MKRNKIAALPQPAYPARPRLGGCVRHRLLLVGLLAVAPVPACDTVTHIDGLMAEPQDQWQAILPADGIRTVYLETEGAWVSYQLVVWVDELVLTDWLEDNAHLLLDRADEILAPLLPEAFAEPDEELWDAEARIRQALADALAGAGDAPLGSIIGVEVSVAEIEPGEACEDDTGC